MGSPEWVDIMLASICDDEDDDDLLLRRLIPCEEDRRRLFPTTTWTGAIAGFDHPKSSIWKPIVAPTRVRSAAPLSSAA